MSTQHNLSQLMRYYDCRHLPQKGGIIAEYVWIDGTGSTMRSKSRTLQGAISSVDQLPDWNYDGSSCYQAVTENSEVIMKPVAFYPDPFRGGDNIIVLCSTYKWKDTTYTDLVPSNTNFRHFAEPIFESPEVKDEKTWFGIEQEYSLLQEKSGFTTWPLGWPSSGYPGPQGPYYCSVGPNHCFGRVMMDAHYKACLYAGVKIAGTNAEVMPGQWEYQVGPCHGIEMGDMLWMSRFLACRVAEDFNVNVSFHPKLFKDWNGAGCHTNYSTKTMREIGGMEYINDMCEKLGSKHSQHVELYGDNKGRLTGIHETSSIDKFTYGIGNRAASVRIPTSVASSKRGYIEDRRPASDIDPYVVAASIADTTLLKESKMEPLVAHYRAWREWIETENIEV